MSLAARRRFRIEDVRFRERFRLDWGALGLYASQQVEVYDRFSEKTGTVEDPFKSLS